MNGQFDTSGSVSFHVHEVMQTKIWTDLDPFTQGYVEAVAGELYRNIHGSDIPGSVPSIRFSDIAPETVARIMGDCARWKARFPCANTPEQGGALWHSRQDPTGFFTGWNLDFPPLTPYLGEEGKVYLSTPSDVLSCLEVGS